MNGLKWHSSRIAEWQSLVLDAEMSCGLHFDENIEHYLVITLDHYTQANHLASTVIALDFLNAVEKSGTYGREQLRTVGDQCLLLSGLFPERAKRKNVSLNYFIGLGKEAYNLVAAQHPRSVLIDEALFYNLSVNFVGLMDVLHTMRYLKQ
jgi:hypothetical protein